MRLITIITILTAASLAAPVRAAEAPPELTTSCGQFFDALKNHKVKEAFAVLLKGSKIADQLEDITKLEQSAEEMIQGYGPVLGYELVKVEPVGMNLCSLRYLTRSERAPVMWQITFYRPADKWRVFNVRVDDKAMDFFGK